MSGLWSNFEISLLIWIVFIEAAQTFQPVFGQTFCSLRCSKKEAISSIMAENNFEDGVIRPLQVPAAHHPKASLKDRTVFALAYLGSGTARQVTAKLEELGDNDATESEVRKTLDGLFDRGLVNGSKKDGQRVYDLAKVTRPHSGHVEPDPPVKSHR